MILQKQMSQNLDYISVLWRSQSDQTNCKTTQQYTPEERTLHILCSLHRSSWPIQRFKQMTCLHDLT
jgi:hypothetical protein